MIEIRDHTLASPEALEEHASTRWTRHVASLAVHGITTHHVWTEVDGDRPRLIAVVEHPEGADPGALTEECMASDEFRADMAGFPRDGIVEVSAVHVLPAPADPSRG
jgi:hypothetical protein